jgi:hypothetical protein
MILHMQSDFSDGDDQKGHQHFNLWLLSWQAEEHHPHVVANQMHGTQVDPAYFLEFQTDYLLWVFGWYNRTAVVEIDNEKLVVPQIIEVLVGTQSGYWVGFQVESHGGYQGNDSVVVTQVNVIGDGSPDPAYRSGRVRHEDVSTHPPFPLRRWAAVAIRDANRRLASGETAPLSTKSTSFSQRSNSPPRERLERVVQLRESDDGLSFARIGERLGISEATASRDFRRGKARGL